MSKASHNLVKQWTNEIDRQGLLITNIPPVAAFVGFTTAVAVGGVVAQTGVLTPLIDAINNIISKIHSNHINFLSNLNIKPIRILSLYFHVIVSFLIQTQLQRQRPLAINKQTTTAG